MGVHSIRRLVSVVSLFAVLFIVLGCGTPYRAPDAPHMYVTNTQDYHDLGGLKISYDTYLSFPAPVTIEYFIDTREIGSHQIFQDYRTMIQLPPGNHQLIVQEKEFPSGLHYVCVYNFTLGRGQIGDLVVSDLREERGTVHFSNVESYQLIDRQIPGFSKILKGIEHACGSF